MRNEALIYKAFLRKQLLLLVNNPLLYKAHLICHGVSLPWGPRLTPGHEIRSAWALGNLASPKGMGSKT